MSPWTAPLTATRPIIILGGGVLGRRLALMWSAAGHPVNLYDTQPKQAEAAVSWIRANVDAQAMKANSKPKEVVPKSDLADAVRDSWMVIEAVPEKIELKTEIFGELDKLTKSDCVLASNSSSYKSSEMISKVQTAYRVCNTHYYIPPENTCVELMSCGKTDETIFPFLMDECASAGFKPRWAKKESTGLIFNRIWAAIKRESLMVMSEGVAEPAEIDTLFQDFFGAERGPCERMDSVGLDTVALIEEHYIDERKNLSREPIEWLRENYIEKGKLGKKTDGEGLYSSK